MFNSLSLLGLAVLFSLVSALPTIRSAQNETASQRLGLQWMGNDTSLPKVLVLFTGGTIASGSNISALDDIQYGQSSITGEEIIARDPYLPTIAQLAVSNWTTRGSSTGTNDTLVMNMARFAHDALCSEDSDIDGAIYTHGTNSLEETGFLLDALINCGKPIVGVGAMRPYTHISFDGDINFFSAVALAANPDARNRGLMVAFANRILSGFWVTKLHANFPDAFHQTSGGDLGTFLNGQPYFFNTPSQPYAKHAFDISAVSSDISFPSLPKVDILYAAREFDGKLVLNAHENGARGVVIAGTGSGSVPTGGGEVAQALEDGLQVVVGSRSPYGASTPSRQPAYAKSGYIHVIHARIVLQLALASGFTMEDTIELFEGGMRATIMQPLSEALEMQYLA